MMKYEFEQLAGYEVTDKDYNEIIEPMYMATNLTKQDFIKTLDRKRFAIKSLKEIEREMKKIARHLAKTFLHYTDYEAKDKLAELAQEYTDRLNAKGYFINDEQKWTCYHPINIDIYGSDYKTIKKIELL